MRIKDWKNFISESIELKSKHLVFQKSVIK